MKVETSEKEGHIIDQDVETCEKLLFLFVQQTEAQFKVEEIYRLDWFEQQSVWTYPQNHQKANEPWTTKKLNIGKCPDMSQRWPNCCRDDQLLQGSERLADCTALIELLRLQRQKLRPMVVSWWEKTPCHGNHWHPWQLWDIVGTMGKTEEIWTFKQWTLGEHWDLPGWADGLSWWFVFSYWLIHHDWGID